MKKSWAFLFCLSLAILLYAIVSLYSLPSLLQAQVLSPKAEKINRELDFAQELLLDKASVSSPTGSSTVTLRAVNHSYFQTYFTKLLEGRFFYKNEKDKVALLDKESALKLYPSVSPLDKTVKIGEHYYTVVGLVEKAPFTQFSSNVYIPLDTALRNKQEGKLFTYTINTKEQSRSEFSHALESDHLWDIPKERERVLLVLKFVFYLGILLLTGYARRWVQKHLAGHYAHLQALNRDYYPRQYLPQILLFIGKILLFYTLIFASYALSLHFILSAVLTFPEVLPEILLDFKLIYESFVNNMQSASEIFVVKSDIITRIEHYGRLIQLSTCLILFCLCSLLFQERKAS